MKVFIDTSVVVRRLLGETDGIGEWGQWERAYVCGILRTEFLRTMDRLRLTGALTDGERAGLQQEFEIFWETCYRIPLGPAVLQRAESAFPTVLGTLDALHLAALLLLREREGEVLELLTHDAQLGRAAMACGVPVSGLGSG